MEEKKSKQKVRHSSADFLVYDEHDIYGLGYTHKQLRAAVLADSKLLMTCRPCSILVTPGHGLRH